MTVQELFDDLKQYIDTGLANVVTKDDIAEVHTQMNLGFSQVMGAIAETMTANNADIDNRIDNHARRITELEQQPAV